MTKLTETEILLNQWLEYGKRPYYSEIKYKIQY
jgi:hypothetical protein